MKKVRYVAGAVGALGVMPLGLMAPQAATATKAPATRTGKTVSPVHRITATCTPRHDSSSSDNLTVELFYSREHGCIGEVKATFNNHSSRGWWLRVRFYTGKKFTSIVNKNGTIHSGARPGANSGSITFMSRPTSKTSITQVCEALLSPSNRTSPAVGPICEPTGF